MGTIAAAVRELIALGVQGDALVSAIERMEAAQIAAWTPTEETPEERKRRISRETSRRHRMSRNVTDASPNVTAENVTECHQTSPGDTNASPLAHVRDKPLSLVPTGVSSEANASSLAGHGREKPISRLKTKRCPEDYQPGPQVLTVAAGEGFTAGEIERELAKFKDHQFRDAHADWDAAFRNWLRRASENRPRNERHDPNRSKQADNLAAAFAGAEIAARWRGSGSGG